MDDHRRLFLHHIFLFYNCFILVLNQIVPILSEKIAESVAESINKALEKKINDHIKPLEKKINDQDKTIVEQKDMMQKQASQ
jgi:hypothetical protein